MRDWIWWFIRDCVAALSKGNGRASGGERAVCILEDQGYDVG